MTNANVTDLTAKLLASENITVVRAPSSTASFDVSARVLTLPLWKDMTPDVESLFVQHEVGHALFTDMSGWMAALDSVQDQKQQRILKGYMNVVEDARIEKLMKRRFPGSRKSFYAGYKQLLERDFFSLKGKDVNTMLFVDRANLYFKGGLTLGIKFSPEEKVIIDKIDRCETLDEMAAIAKEMYEFSKEQMQKPSTELDGIKVSIPFEDQDDDKEEEDDDFDDEYGGEYVDDQDLVYDENDEDAVDNSQPGKGPASENPLDESLLESETDRNLNEKLEELADTSTQYRYFEIETQTWRDPIVGFKQVLIDTTIVDEKIVENARDYNVDHKKEFDAFMIESERMVNYLVKEFEMRKSAQAYRRAQVSKSGSLNMNKIHAYKLTDDLFRRVTTIPDGKNHGMIFLLDWSGSMQDVILQTVKQVINLAMFCRRINIPFEVYAFTGQYHSQHLNKDQMDAAYSYNYAMARRSDKNILFSDGYFSLLNLFSSKMTNREFQTAARRFTTYNFLSARGYSMGDTPLNEALVEMLKFIPSYKRRNNIEKLTLITLSDGAGGSLGANKAIRRMDYSSAGVRIKIKNFISDEVTSKTYEINDQSYSTTEALLRMIKDRYDITLLGFYICANRRRTLIDVYRDHFGSSASDHQIETMRAGFRQHGFYSIKDTGRDDLFIVPDTSTKIIDSELEVDTEMSAAQIARKFAKTMNTKKHSRVLLDRFIGYVA